MKVAIFTSHSRWVKPGYLYRATTLSSKPYKFDLQVYKTFTGFSSLYPCAEELTSAQMTQQINDDGPQGFQILLLGDGDELSEPKPVSDFDLLIALPALGPKCFFYDKDLHLVPAFSLSEHLKKHGIEIEEHSLEAWMSPGVYAQTFVKLLMETIDTQCETNYKEDLQHINWNGGLPEIAPKKKVPVTKWILKGGKVSFPVQEEPKPETEYVYKPPVAPSKPLGWTAVDELTTPSADYFAQFDQIAAQNAKSILKAKLSMKLEQEKLAAQKQTYHYENGKVVGVTISSNTPPKSYDKPSYGFPKKKFIDTPKQSYQDLSKAWAKNTKVE